MFVHAAAAVVALAFSPAQIRALDSAVIDFMHSKHIAGASVALAQDGTIFYARGYGFRDVLQHKRADEHTIYQIGSVTKQFTAAAILQLARDGKLRLSDTLSTWIPSYEKGARVTIRQLLEQTSGVPDYSLDPDFTTWSYTVQTPDQILRRIDYLDLHFEPGSQWQYSNTNYLLLGTIVEKVSGMRFADYVHANLTLPLHLNATGYPDAFNQQPNVALGYRWEIKRFVPVPYQTTAAFSAGALASNVTDLIAWDAALHDERVLPHDLTEAMFKPTDAYSTGDVSYGFGMELVGMYGHVVAGHAGNISGFSSYTGTIRETGVEMAILTNATDIDLLPLAKTFVAILAKPV